MGYNSVEIVSFASLFKKNKLCLFNIKQKTLNIMKMYGIILLLISFTSFSQGEANNWFFSSQCGVQFNSGPPLANNVTPMITSEASAVASDASGNLLFYTNGNDVYDANHNVMANGGGLMGSFFNVGSPNNGLPGTAAQGAGIVPYPGNVNKFYIFTLGSVGDDSLRYSIVDMSLSGGLGNVTNVKNVSLAGSLSEKMTIVKHGNCQNYWVMTHNYPGSDFYAFEVTSLGINPPVITTIGAGITSLGQGAAQPMKFSPDGSFLVNPIGSSFVQLFDFDNNSGVLSNLRSTPAGFFDAYDNIYGIEFSPNSGYFYVTQQNNFQNNYTLIWQFPVDLPDFWNGGQFIQGNLPPQNQVSVFLVGGMNGMQLGPDGRIYIARFGEPFLSTIDFPNLQGPACSYSNSSVSFGGLLNLPPAPGVGAYGLPLFPQNLFNEPSEFIIQGGSNICQGDTAFFVYNGALNPDSVLWDFGDPTSGILNQSTQLDADYLYTNTGTYSVQLVVWKDCIIDTASYDIVINPIPNFDLGQDTVLCEGNSINFDFTSYVGNEFLWSDGSATPDLSVMTTGVYYLQMTTQDGCSFSDTVNIDFIAFPDATISVLDDTMCVNDSPILISSATTGGSWSGVGVDVSGNFNPSIGAGIYTITYSFGSLCPAENSVIINVFDIPVMDFSVDTLYGCEPLTVVFTDNNLSLGQTSNWYFGDGTQSSQIGSTQHTYLNSGSYSVTLETTSQAGCFNSQTLAYQIEVYPNPIAQFDYSQVVTDTGTIVQFNDLSTGAVSWAWSLGGGVNSSLQNPISTYVNSYNNNVILSITSQDGCVDFASVDFKALQPFYFYVPNSFTPNEDGTNDIFKPILTGSDEEAYTFTIYDRWGILLFETTSVDEGWNGISIKTGQPVQIGTYSWVVKYNSRTDAGVFLKTGHVNLIR
ncbi:MAG: gliding motility-associated-like protein [Salibacteraceae bacterium]|jgi:gliding motility-associated-like protein